MQSDRVAQRGYSLTEILVVLAIIGILSLVTVPQFIAYQQSSALKGAMRNFNADVRNARQLAVSRYVTVRINFENATTYHFYYRATPTDTWQDMPQELLMALRISGTTGSRKSLKSPMTFISNEFVDLVTSSGPGHDIIFNNDGTITVDTDQTHTFHRVTIASPWKNITYNRMTITLYITGKIDTTASKG
jgi:prepilin-type N-terminal cleavage/methylation domain-containing protein